MSRHLIKTHHRMTVGILGCTFKIFSVFGHVLFVLVLKSQSIWITSCYRCHVFSSTASVHCALYSVRRGMRHLSLTSSFQRQTSHQTWASSQTWPGWWVRPSGRQQRPPAWRAPGWTPATPPWSASTPSGQSATWPPTPRWTATSRVCIIDCTIKKYL